MLEFSVALLRRQGYEDLYVQDQAEESEDEIIVPEMQRQPDIIAKHPDQPGPLLGVVESTDELGEETCGRRWQVFAHWARKHRGQLMIFVSPDDAARATLIARHWHVDPGLLMPVGQKLH